MKMMATFRIIPRLRIPHAPQSVVTRSLICEKNTRFLCYGEEDFVMQVSLMSFIIMSLGFTF